jgi:hypothetical protein
MIDLQRLIGRHRDNVRYRMSDGHTMAGGLPQPPDGLVPNSFDTKIWNIVHPVRQMIANQLNCEDEVA